MRPFISACGLAALRTGTSPVELGSRGGAVAPPAAGKTLVTNSIFSPSERLPPDLIGFLILIGLDANDVPVVHVSNPVAEVENTIVVRDDDDRSIRLHSHVPQ